MQVLLVDDHKIVIEGLKELLLKCPLIKSVETITNPKYVQPYLNSNKFNLLITDINMPELNGIDLIKKIKPSFPDIKIGVLSMYFNKSIIDELLLLKVNFCLHKNIEFNELEIALHHIVNEDSTFMQKNIVQSFTGSRVYSYEGNDDVKYILSPREMEVFKLILKGHKSYEIADLLFVSINTIMAHRKNILKKTKCKSVNELIQLGMKLGLDQE